MQWFEMVKGTSVRWTYIFVFGDDVFEQCRSYLGIVSVLLQGNAVDLPRLHFPRNIIGVHLTGILVIEAST